MDPIDPDLEKWAEKRREFAATRSHQDAEQSNENWRYAAQTSTLINGGAATALLALLSKERIDPYVVNYASYGLIFYALGVVFSAYVLYCMKHALKKWNQSWQHVIRTPRDEKAGETEHNEATDWYDRANRFLYASMGSFVAGSVIVALVLLTSSHQTPILPGSALTCVISPQPAACPATR